ncbi:ester cyclase [Litorilinea aerophila]|uniref:Ester cyclase n=1 Tax=Litorilinea aerophila TaxID=1204385 RepID=A0A540VH05_9CHLR|nr:ester cyclase [Litorilinea aerophila]MCC9076439.1 ester cyclase [Litorilinea aerophila]GIV79079.1 MAG: cyclase [Litorilinea sp.]
MDATGSIAELLDRLNQAWNSHDLAQVLPFYADDYEGTDVGVAAPLKGRAALASMLAGYWQAFPDLAFAELERIVEGNRVAIVWVAHGTHRGPIMNIPPSGRKLEVTGVSILLIEDGLVRRGRYIWDVAGVLRKIGLLPDLA